VRDHAARERTHTSHGHGVVLAAEKVKLGATLRVLQPFRNDGLAALFGPIAAHDLVLDRGAVDDLAHAVESVGRDGRAGGALHVEHLALAGEKGEKVLALDSSDFLLIGGHGSDGKRRELAPEGLHVTDDAVEQKPSHPRERRVTCHRLERLVHDRLDHEHRTARVLVDEIVDLLRLNELVAFAEVDVERCLQVVRHGHRRRFLKALVLVLPRQKKNPDRLRLHFPLY
jgi:hypothetical protein